MERTPLVKVEKISRMEKLLFLLAMLLFPLGVSAQEFVTAYNIKSEVELILKFKKIDELIIAFGRWLNKK